jgi:sugar lactone lactonase YvrE
VTDTDVEVVLRAHAQVGEGPVWDERTKTLFWVDIMANAVHAFDPATGDDRAIDVGQPIGAAALRESGGLVLALRDGFAVMDASLDDLRWVAQVEHDISTNRMNDGKCDARGRFWAGTMAFNPDSPVGSFYRLDPDYRVRRVFGDVTISNGIDWTPDDRQMYYIDSPTQRIDVFDFDLQKGELGTRQTLVEIPSEDGMPDGMTVDVEGGVWVALYGGGAVHRYTRDGRFDRSIVLPVKHVTCPAFGGRDYADLYITSMTFELPPETLGDRSLAGSIFRTRPGVRGRPPYRFAG